MRPVFDITRSLAVIAPTAEEHAILVPPPLRDTIFKIRMHIPISVASDRSAHAEIRPEGLAPASLLAILSRDDPHRLQEDSELSGVQPWRQHL
jgi:hypothetical protein